MPKTVPSGRAQHARAAHPRAQLARRARRSAQCTSLLDPPRASFSPKSLVQKLARPLGSTCTRRIFCKNMLKHAYVCMTAFFNDFLDAPEAYMRATSYDLVRQGENAHVQTYTGAQQMRASAPILPTRCFRFSCTLHSDTVFEGCL